MWLLFAQRQATDEYLYGMLSVVDNNTERLFELKKTSNMTMVLGGGGVQFTYYGSTASVFCAALRII